MILLILVLALLVGNSAGSLASGLARSLALTAAALGSAVLQSGAVESLNVFHGNLLRIIFTGRYPHKFGCIIS